MGCKDEDIFPHELAAKYQADDERGAGIGAGLVECF